MSKKVRIVYTVELSKIKSWYSYKDSAEIKKIESMTEAKTIQKLIDKFKNPVSDAGKYAVIIIALIIAAYLAKILLISGGGSASSGVIQQMKTLTNVVNTNTFTNTMQTITTITKTIVVNGKTTITTITTTV